MESLIVGRPKKKPLDSGRKPVAITIKGDLEWRKWVEGGAEMCLMSVATLADIAITEYLERRGYKAKRPKRLP